MADDINSVVLVGRIVRDCELKYSKTGSPIVNMSIAVNHTKKDGDEYVDEASFFDLVLFGKRGEALSQYLLKGSQISIIGKLKQERWSKDGENKSKINIIVENIQLLGSKNNSQSSPQAPPKTNHANFEDDCPW